MPDTLSSTSKPIVQILLFGRDDGYHADYIERTAACLNYNLRAIHKASAQDYVQLVFADCGVECTLADKLCIYKPYLDSISFLHIPVGDLSLTCDSNISLPTSLIQNTTLLSSNSPYIFWGASDLLFSATSIRNLVSYLICSLDAKSDIHKYLLINRVTIDPSYFTSNRCFSEVDYCLDNFIFPPEPISGAGGHAGFIGGFRDFLISNGGLSTSSTWGGNDIDIFLRLSRINGTHHLSYIAGVLSHKIPYSSSGKRSSVVSSSVTSWSTYLDYDPLPLSPDSGLPISSVSATTTSDLPFFPKLFTPHFYHDLSWHFYSRTRVSLPSLESYCKSITLKHIISQYLPKSIVLSGSYNHHLVRTIFFFVHPVPYFCYLMTIVQTLL